MGGRGPPARTLESAHPATQAQGAADPARRAPDFLDPPSRAAAHCVSRPSPSMTDPQAQAGPLYCPFMTQQQPAYSSPAQGPPPSPAAPAGLVGIAGAPPCAACDRPRNPVSPPPPRPVSDAAQGSRFPRVTRRRTDVKPWSTPTWRGRSPSCWQARREEGKAWVGVGPRGARRGARAGGRRAACKGGRRPGAHLEWVAAEQ
jgi:hypothetical protein